MKKILLLQFLIIGFSFGCAHSTTEPVAVEKVSYNRYFDQLREKIHESWSVPQELADKNYKAKVIVFIDNQGAISKKKMVASSGNETFDARVMEAVKKSSPFPPPPDGLKGILSTQGIVFSFP